MAKKPIDKGGKAEEAIRSEFLKRGYFVVRALPYRFSGFEVTDVDLLLYGPTGAGREFVNVDVKNKKTPQAMERIFWAMGIRSALRCDRCIVATSEANPAVVDFGRRFGVAILDGRYLQRIMSHPITGRISEEDFLDSLWFEDAADFSDGLLARYMTAKSRLLTLRGYDACNAFLRDAGECLSDLLAFPACRAGVRRVLYAVTAFLCVSLDSQWARSDFSEMERRIAEMDSGLRYGSMGRQRIDEFVYTLQQCKSDDPTVGRVIEGIQNKIETGTKEIRADILTDFVGKWGHELFPLARKFEQAAFAERPPTLSALDTGVKSFLFMLADYFGLDRVKIGAC